MTLPSNPETAPAAAVAPPVGSAPEPVEVNAGAGAAGGRRAVQIAPSMGWPRLDLAELWAYRELLWLLVWRDVKSRYSQTILGAGWAILQPVLAMIVFSLIFGRFARVPSDGVPYPVFSLAGLVPWSYFSSALSGSSQSLVTNRNLLTKVYFPRLVIPTAQVLASLVDFGIAFGVLLLMMLGFGMIPGLETLWMLPILLAIISMTALGAGSLLAALNVQYRDVRHLSPFLLQLWMFASPIVYPMSLLPESYRTPYALNPLAGAITGFRAMLLGTAPATATQLGLSLLGAAGILVVGTLYFRRTERVFADIV